MVAGSIPAIANEGGVSGTRRLHILIYWAVYFNLLGRESKMYICKWCRKKVFDVKPDVEKLKAGEVIWCHECGKFLFGKNVRGKLITRKGEAVLNIAHHGLLHDAARIAELGEDEINKRLAPAIVYVSEVHKSIMKGKKTKRKVKVKEDLINRPPHYLRGGIAAIDVIEAWDLPFHLANVIKYMCRAGSKQGEKAVDDLRKAKFYLDRYIGEKNGK